MICDRSAARRARWSCHGVVFGAVLLALPAAARVPDEIGVPAESPGMALHAEGAQIYECQADGAKGLNWQPREPTATLMDGDKSVGRHYAALRWEAVDAGTLIWEHNDGSAVKARIVVRVAGRGPDDLPWLKLNVTAQTGNGLFYGVTHVQRVNTQGGLISGPCDQAGTYRSVPYSADYVFWRAE
jgi:Protein of unknown function (DUF3455)